MGQTQQILDEYLVTLVWNGDRSAAERLARRWHPRLLRAARRMLGDAEAAHGATQDSWLAIIKSIHRLSDPARFAPWAFTILRRKCADVIKHSQSRRAVMDDGELPDAASDSATSEDSAAIAQAFAALPPDQRLAAHLFFVEGLTLAELAEVQAIPVGTAKSRLFHARQKLKAALSGENP